MCDNLRSQTTPIQVQEPAPGMLSVCRALWAAGTRAHGLVHPLTEKKNQDEWLNAIVSERLVLST